jgi:hypothetical protein
MFELVDIVNDNLAIFRRTGAPTFDPRGDGWWEQGYNRAHYKSWVESITSAGATVSAPAPPSLFGTIARPVVRQALRGAAMLTPKGLKARMPDRMKKTLWNKM